MPIDERDRLNGACDSKQVQDPAVEKNADPEMRPAKEERERERDELTRESRLGQPLKLPVMMRKEGDRMRARTGAPELLWSLPLFNRGAMN